MPKAALVAAIAALAIVLAAGVYVSGSARPASVVPTPSPTPAASASASAPPAVSTSPAPSANPSGASGAVTVQVSRTTVPSEFHYMVLGGGEEMRLVVLDLGAGRVTQV